MFLFLFLSSCHETLSSTARLKIQRGLQKGQQKQEERNKRRHGDDGGGKRPVRGYRFDGVSKANGIII